MVNCTEKMSIWYRCSWYALLLGWYFSRWDKTDTCSIFTYIGTISSENRSNRQPIATKLVLDMLPSPSLRTCRKKFWWVIGSGGCCGSSSPSYRLGRRTRGLRLRCPTRYALQPPSWLRPRLLFPDFLNHMISAHPINSFSSCLPVKVVLLPYNTYCIFLCWICVIPILQSYIRLRNLYLWSV